MPASSGVSVDLAADEEKEGASLMETSDMMMMGGGGWFLDSFNVEVETDLKFFCAA